MARKPTEYVQFKLRIRESLRRKIERAAELRKQSANAEAVWRIERTFSQDEEIAAQAEKMEAREAELQEMFQQQTEQKIQRDARYASALRDSLLLTMMAGSTDNVELLRVMMHYIHKHSDWSASAEKRKALAEEIQSFLSSADDVFQGQSK